MFTEERDSDTVKRIRISEKDTLFFVTLIEHKTKVDYNVSMQLLRYMVYIWEDYEKELEEFRELNLPKDYLKNLSENSTDELLDIIARVTATMLRHLHLPEDEISEFTDQVKERDMAVLFEHFKDVNLPAERKKARAEGLAEGLAKGLAEGESRFAKLTQLLLKAGRMDDLTKAVSDPEYRKKLYLQNGL